jgi:hypothetical protein
MLRVAMMRRRNAVVALSLLPAAVALAAGLGGPLPGPLPLFPSDNWWNLDISTAPVDPGSAAFINFIGATRGLHPDFGGEETPGSDAIYGFPYIVVKADQPKKTVQFVWPDESDGVDHSIEESYPFYPIPDDAITQPHWVEGGQPGNVDLRDEADRHILIVDEDNRFLYELYNVWHDGTHWQAGSGAFFDMKTNNRRPDTWTSADAAGLAILPGLVRYDEAFGAAEIGHAFRVTVRATNGYVYPASHRAGSTPGALPMGARLRLKANKDISTFTPECQRIFRAMKKYGLIVADNGSDMYVSGTFDTRWDNDVLNPAFRALKASDFEVVQLGWNPGAATPAISIDDVNLSEGSAGTTSANFTVALSAASGQPVTVNWTTANGTATAGTDYVAAGGTLTFSPGVTSRPVAVAVNGDTVVEPNETFFVNLSGASGGTISDAQGRATINNDDSLTPVRAAMQTPVPGSTLTGATVTFNWNAGTGVTSYWLEVGTAPGGKNIYPGANTAALSATVAGLPTNGSAVYVRLWSLISATWVYDDYQYTAAGTGGSAKAVMQTPAPGSTLPGTSTTFTWSAGVSVSSYWLEVGTTPGGRDIHPGANTTALSATVNGLPTNGSNVHARLWSRIGASWVYNDYQYTAATGGGGSAKAVMQTPAPGSTLAGAAVTFTWSAGSGVTSYWLEVGTTPGGRNLFPGSNTTTPSAAVNGLPTNGSNVYVRLWSKLAGAWQYNDYQYKAAGGSASSKAVMQTPAPGSALTGTTVTFTWSAGSGVSSYWLEVGTTLGGRNLYPGANTTALSATVSGLPANGSVVYVRLWSRIGAAWQYNDYQYTAAIP